MSRGQPPRQSVERRVKSVIAGNKMAGFTTSPATVERMKAVATGTVTAEQAIAAVIDEHSQPTKVDSAPLPTPPETTMTA